MARQIAGGTLHHRYCADVIASGVVVKCDSQLDQSLQKLLFVDRRGAPDVFEHFMRVEELSLVKQANAVSIGMEIKRL